MATVSLYNHTRARFLDGAFNVGDTYIVNLYTVLPFNATATTRAEAEAGATQVATANGYTQNAKALTNLAVSIINTNEARLDADDVTWTASGGSLSATHVLVFNDTHPDDAPVLRIDLEGALLAESGSDLRLQWDANGIITSTAPA
jgi:hypothetical protein